MVWLPLIDPLCAISVCLHSLKTLISLMAFTTILQLQFKIDVWGLSTCVLQNITSHDEISNLPERYDDIYYTKLQTWNFRIQTHNANRKIGIRHDLGKSVNNLIDKM